MTLLFPFWYIIFVFLLPHPQMGLYVLMIHFLAYINFYLIHLLLNLINNNIIQY